MQREDACCLEDPLSSHKSRSQERKTLQFANGNSEDDDDDDCLIPHHVQFQRQSRMAKWNGPSIRHAATTVRPNGQRTQRTRKKARVNTLRPRSPTARLASDTPRLPILPGERKNVHEPLEAHHGVLCLTQSVKAGRAVVGGKIQTRLVLQIAVRLKTTTTSMTDLNTH